MEKQQMIEAIKEHERRLKIEMESMTAIKLIIENSSSLDSEKKEYAAESVRYCREEIDIALADLKAAKKELER